MKITLLMLGKTDDAYIETGVEKYIKRIKRYVRFDIKELPDIKKRKNYSEKELKQKEGELILAKIPANDFLILLDENGKIFTSVQFAAYLENKMLNSQNITFVIGGAYGFSEAVYQKADAKISLSKMTFSHQLVRLIFAEQLYRGFSIIKGEPYHHK